MTKSKVLNVFKKAGEPIRPGTVVEETGLDKKEVSKYIKELKEEEKIYSPKRCFYQIK